MRVVFAGTPAFALRALEALVAAGHEVALVLSQPDRPAGRGLKLTPSAVTAYARARGLEVHQPDSLKSEASQAALRAARPEVLVVAAYGLILPQSVLDIPARGALNIHASLLPRWRGAAPIARAILAGDAQTGICIMRMEAGLDQGPVLLERPVRIEPRATSATLTERLAQLGAEAIVEALANLDHLRPRSQDEAQATYATKIRKIEARIDWRQSSAAIDRQVRAFDPFPGAETVLSGAPLKVWDAFPSAGNGLPGGVLEPDGERLRVACGEGALTIVTLQRSGSRRLGSGAFLRGNSIAPGTVLGEESDSKAAEPGPAK